MRVRGFYDGDGAYKVRFMPDAIGEWSYATESRAPAVALGAEGLASAPVTRVLRRAELQPSRRERPASPGLHVRVYEGQWARLPDFESLQPLRTVVRQRHRHHIDTRYTINIMPKQAISVTLDTTNLVWLRARVGSGGGRSVSALLDHLVAEARMRGTLHHEPTSVVGTIDLATSDPLLLRADDRIRAVFRSSLGRPLLVEERRVAYRASKRLRRG